MTSLSADVNMPLATQSSLGSWRHAYRRSKEASPISYSTEPVTRFRKGHTKEDD